MAHKKHIKKRRRSPIRFLFLLILLIAVLIGIVVFMLHSKLGKVQTKVLDQSQLVTVNNDNNMKDYTNYAFFGIDSQTGSMSDRGNRSDSIIVVSINNSTKEVKLLSIYRDTFLSINGKYSKINAAYSWGGPELAISTINRNLDLNIEKYATVNFKILANIVDAVGGIEVKVDKSIIKNLNSYIKDMNRINGGNSSTIKSAGTYTLDGNQAVAYSRIRYTAGGDLARAGRQREVLEKIFEKGKKNPFKMMSVMDEVLPQVKTNMSQDELFKMVLSVFKYNIKDQQGFPWNQKEMRYYGSYYGFPTTLKENAIRAHKYLFGTKDYQVSDELSRINQKIIYRVGY
jgi:LCP family protein required for cell wall assembly